MDKHIKIEITEEGDDGVRASVSIVGDEEFLVKGISSTLLSNDNLMNIMMKSVRAAIIIKNIGKEKFMSSEEITPTIDKVIELSDLDHHIEGIQEPLKSEPFSGTVEDIKNEIKTLFKTDDESKC